MNVRLLASHSRLAAANIVRRTKILGPLAAALTLALFASRDDTHGAGPGNSVTEPGGGGQYMSLRLDASGFPVLSGYGGTDLVILHCNDVNCAGGDDSVTTPDSIGNVGAYTSLALDSLGFPVVSYYDITNENLKVLHCINANCTAGGSITSPDTAGIVGAYTSIALDASGNPVVSYWDNTNNDLKVMHCIDPNCATAPSITSPDTNMAGSDTTLVLDASGNPVVSYQGTSNLKLLHCNDPNCAGGDDSIQTLDTMAGEFSSRSLALDASGFPVVSYLDGATEDLNVIHCNDANCAGGDESITTPDSAGHAGFFNSLALDASGFPVVSYTKLSTADGLDPYVMLLRCNDPNCAPGGDSLVAADRGGLQGTSLALDAAGFPVIATSSQTGPTSVIHCGSATCLGNQDVDQDGCMNKAEMQTASGSQVSGALRDPLNFWDFFDTPDTSNVRDKAVAGTDFFRVLGRFGSQGSPNMNPLEPPPAAPAYHPAFDRGPSSGPNVWNLTKANGSIAGTDFFAILAQFGHQCL